ncbi:MULTISPECIES: SHOCT domain-containing protein [Christiangramia]|uniref:SHOCT domain-containing protein n=9 Tax=Flavobacteriaceae TaxID=49546 RepID=A0A9X2KXT4_9FLAO|nr:MULTISPECIES: SHOCT domain-containing protein [Christiangramia]MCP9200254.1 SHOCT domain-containing protein [Gramella oceanisediminis]WPY97373.1 SHOCT domain-containing protein [Christiangramia sp. OXR-203]GGG40577.1 hypothetical protein GCM10011532_25380 [Christiangramia forsetii]CAL66165.1 hypothetical protein GFO_1191 [Christiangramia forsetii KT0803]|tara:strand:- start:65 stop:361 length:297 start_codon:yes stop_codon:yes gene_type:complete
MDGERKSLKKLNRKIMMDNWNFGGMHWIWWGLWIILIFWIFLIPYPTPGQKRKKDGAMEILRERFARGEISEEEYKHRVNILQNKNEPKDQKKIRQEK